MTEFDKLKQAADSDEVRRVAAMGKMVVANTLAQTFIALADMDAVNYSADRIRSIMVEHFEDLEQPSEYMIWATLLYGFLHSSEIITIGIVNEEDALDADIQTKCAIIMNMVQHLEASDD